MNPCFEDQSLFKVNLKIHAIVYKNFGETLTKHYADFTTFRFSDINRN